MIDASRSLLPPFENKQKKNFRVISNGGKIAGAVKKLRIWRARKFMTFTNKQTFREYQMEQITRRPSESSFCKQTVNARSLYRFFSVEILVRKHDASDL